MRTVQSGGTIIDIRNRDGVKAMKVVDILTRKSKSLKPEDLTALKRVHAILDDFLVGRGLTKEEIQFKCTTKGKAGVQKWVKLERKKAPERSK